MEKDLKSLKFNELLDVAKKIKYYPPSYSIEMWTPDDIYHGALSETLQSKYQIKASFQLCNTFTPLKLLFKNTIRNYIKIMIQRSKENSNYHENVNELSF